MKGEFGSVVTAGSQSSTFGFTTRSPTQPVAALVTEACDAFPNTPAVLAASNASRRSAVVWTSSPPSCSSVEPPRPLSASVGAEVAGRCGATEREVHAIAKEHKTITRGTERRSIRRLPLRIGEANVAEALPNGPLPETSTGLVSSRRLCHEYQGGSSRRTK